MKKKEKVIEEKVMEYSGKNAKWNEVYDNPCKINKGWFGARMKNTKKRKGNVVHTTFYEYSIYWDLMKKHLNSAPLQALKTPL